jgi:hypothetical protein
MGDSFSIRKELSLALQIDLNNGRKTIRRTDGKESLLSQPRIDLQGTDFAWYLKKVHLVSELDKLAPYLWLVSNAYVAFREKSISQSP